MSSIDWMVLVTNCGAITISSSKAYAELETSTIETY